MHKTAAAHLSFCSTVHRSASCCSTAWRRNTRRRERFAAVTIRDDPGHANHAPRRSIRACAAVAGLARRADHLTAPAQTRLSALSAQQARCTSIS
eukprot:5632629-Pleurochrysis_carterae.AAC.2